MKRIVLLSLITIGINCDRDIENIFTDIFKYNKWACQETVSGGGSTLHETRHIRNKIPELLKLLGIKTILDAPCGDCHWIEHMDLANVHYIGADVVEDIVWQSKMRFANKPRFTEERFSFLHLNIITGSIPKVDLILCRDCLIHFEHELVIKTLKNMKRSGSTYLLTTHYPLKRNRNIKTGSWHPINLTQSPFNLQEPLLIINEQCSIQNLSDKSLALWRLDDITL